MASGTSGAGKSPIPAAAPPPPAAAKECESCRSAPGIPFCRVEWSFLCAGCASIVHGHNWIVAVNPNPSPSPSPNPNPNPNPNTPCAYHYPYVVPNPNNPNPSGGAVVQLSSDEDGGPSAAGPYRRRASVMRYREKRKSRRFEKTVRYANRKEYADLRPRVDGKFARPVAGAGEGEVGVVGDGDEMEGRLEEREAEVMVAGSELLPPMI